MITNNGFQESQQTHSNQEPAALNGNEAFQDLSDNKLMNTVLSFLSPNDFSAARATCKTFRTSINHLKPDFIAQVNLASLKSGISAVELFQHDHAGGTSVRVRTSSTRDLEVAQNPRANPDTLKNIANRRLNFHGTPDGRFGNAAENDRILHAIKTQSKNTTYYATFSHSSNNAACATSETSAWHPSSITSCTTTSSPKQYERP